MKIGLHQYWNLLVDYLKPQKGQVIKFAIALLTSIGLQLINPQILRYFIDAAVAGSSRQNLFFAALLFIGVALVTQVISIAATYYGENVAWRVTNTLRADLVEHCLRLDLSFHKLCTPGELLERVDGDVQTLSEFFSNFTVHILGNLLLMLGVIVVLFTEDWRAGLAIAFFALTALSTLIRLRSIAVPHWGSYRQISADFFGFVGEQLAGMEDVRANGAKSYVMQRFHKILQRWLTIFHKARFASTILWGTTNGIFTLGTAIALSVGAYLWSQNIITIGTVYLLYYYTDLLNEPIEQIRNQFEDLQQAEASIYRIQDLLRVKSQLSAGGEQQLPHSALSVTFENVSFSYHDWGLGNSEFPEGIRGNGELGISTTAVASPCGLGVSRQSPQLWEPKHGEAALREAFPTQATANPKGGGSCHSLQVGKATQRGGSPSEASGVGDKGQWGTQDLVLQNISFDLPPGHLLGLLGRTGSGKSSLARLLLRLYDAQSGSIRLGGVPINQTSLTDLPKKIGLVTQDVQLFQTTVRNNLTFFNQNINDECIYETLEILGLSEWLHSLPQGLDTNLGPDSSGLSAGQAQLLAFTRVFLKDPGLVILDEASSRLDPITEKLIEKAVDKLLIGRTGIIIAHRLTTVERANQILILEQGRVSEYGSREELLKNPHSRFAQLLQTSLTNLLI